MNLLIFPNNLYEIKYLPKNIKKIYIIEEPVFFGYRDIKLNFNKLKLVLHRSSMKYYESYVKNKYNVKYIEFDILKNKHTYDFINPLDNICYFELNDHFLQNKINNMTKNKNVIIINNPNFIITTLQLKKYNDDNNIKDKFFHKNFYNFVKNEINVLKNIKSYDNENREKIKPNIKIPDLPKKKKSKFELEAIEYIEKRFKNNYGNINNLLFPINHIETKKWLKYFLIHKLKNFGRYQDAIMDNNNFLFHSTISPMLNIGLINPKYIITETIKYYLKNKNIGINNLEGFIRQIIGWREYQRYCYLYKYNEMKNSNYFNHKNKLSKHWYYGSTNILPLDNAIKNAFNTGYLHHIERLMIVSNLMNLCEISPNECYKWFMEFSVDSYDWVMIQNVYSMGQYSDGGLTIKKPYISSDNYILKMSNYAYSNWCKIWNSLFYYFILKNNKKLSKTPYVRNLVFYNKLSKIEQKNIKNTAKSFIKIISSLSK